MNLYEVSYSTGSSDGYSTFQPTSSSTQYLTMTVQAIHQTQARDMVESMNGGSRRCQIHRVMQR